MWISRATLRQRWPVPEKRMHGTGACVAAGAVLKVLKGTARISGMILFIILGATTFAQILSLSGASSGLVQFITSQGLSTLKREMRFRVNRP